jgi:glutathione peroxidase
MNIYDFNFKDTDDEVVSLNAFKGKVMLIANTASKCGFTPQYEGLQALYEKYQESGLEIIGFPSNQFLEQEPGSNEEIKSFCQLNYGVTFPLSQKIDVRGKNIDPLFKYLISEQGFKGFNKESEGGKKMHGFLLEKLPHLLDGDEIKWNFTKFLVDRNGNVVKRYESPVAPEDIAADIEQYL